MTPLNEQMMGLNVTPKFDDQTDITSSPLLALRNETYRNLVYAAVVPENNYNNGGGDDYNNNYVHGGDAGNFSLSKTCINETCHGVSHALFRHELGVGVILCIGYIVVFILGLVGNSFVIAVVIRLPRMRTVTNYFIVNLAVADVLVIVFCLPANLISSVYVPWMLGVFMCKSFTYVQTVSVSASVNSLVAVSLDRFLAIWFPIRPQLSKRVAMSLIVLIWIVAMVTAVPMAVYFDLVTYEDTPGWDFCVEVWPNPQSEKFYFMIAHLLLCYLVPLKLISAFYIMIWIKVAHRSIPGDTRDGALTAMQQRSKIKVVKMLAVVVLIFVLSWLPLYVIFARIKLGGELDEREVSIIEIVTPIAQWLGASNSCINPILYAFFNNKFRRGFLALLKSKSCFGTLRSDAYTESIMRCSSYYTQHCSMVRRTPSSFQTRSVGVVYSISGRSITPLYGARPYFNAHSFDGTDSKIERTEPPESRKTEYSSRGGANRSKCASSVSSSSSSSSSSMMIMNRYKAMSPMFEESNNVMGDQEENGKELDNVLNVNVESNYSLRSSNTIV